MGFMELFFGIVLLLGFFILLFIIFIAKEENDNIVPSAVIGALMMAFLIAGISLLDEYYSSTITPIDVYRGKTTLEITYRDSIAIDSTVVWKVLK